ncbi:hypothetical protein [Enterococcus mundtii]|uniref:hypothetical protein n=1 Tax=Enterococcus mundtii TaxID=53346 RepID=UPI0003810435|nr:hypothetical protein [Enterococcus mundtii]
MATISFERKISLTNKDMEIAHKAKPTSLYYDSIQAVKPNSNKLLKSKDIPAWMKKA